MTMKLIKVIKQKIKSAWEQVVEKGWIICPHTLQTSSETVSLNTYLDNGGDAVSQALHSINH